MRGSNLLTAVGSIPSPGSASLGPFRAYGALIALGALVCIVLVAKRMPGRNFHPDVASEIALPGILAGVIGARLYHVITDWKWDEFWAIWKGGLGIPGGIVLGTVSVLLFARYKGYAWAPLFDVVAPGVPLAQAIGRWGNWFNQELFGKPTDLPWGLEIDPAHRGPAYQNVETFHPTFLYESLWNLALCFFLLWLDKKRILRPGRLFAVYTAGYAIGRLWIEALRIDNATKIFGVRINIWTMSAVLIVSLLVLAVSGRRAEGEDDFGRVVAPAVVPTET